MIDKWNPAKLTDGQKAYWGAVNPLFKANYEWNWGEPEVEARAIEDDMGAFRRKAELEIAKLELGRLVMQRDALVFRELAGKYLARRRKLLLISPPTV